LAVRRALDDLPEDVALMGADIDGVGGRPQAAIHDLYGHAVIRLVVGLPAPTRPAPEPAITWRPAASAAVPASTRLTPVATVSMALTRRLFSIMALSSSVLTPAAAPACRRPVESVDHDTPSARGPPG